MSSIGPDSTLQVPIYLQHDFEVDPDGISYLLSSVFISDEDEPQEIRVLLDDVVGAAIRANTGIDLPFP